jgi:hypothetical protein
MTGLHNNSLQLTKAARCAPFAFRPWRQSLRAAFAAEAGDGPNTQDRELFDRYRESP